ncbi:MAG: hypothetical protein DMG65_13955 [Candidatus Angelobacter sp. Gp1-AA117]|nr:MAG: hypothetical protein DMG65_13955 [Candidatus Angelobacter sp. Gp1-AA117]
MYCNHCGKVIQDDALLCAYCGKNVACAVVRKRLMRARGPQRKIGGVCAAFANYFDLDVTLIRIVWLVCLICAGIGAVAYVVCWIVIPEEPLALVPAAGVPDKVANM